MQDQSNENDVRAGRELLIHQIGYRLFVGRGTSDREQFAEAMARDSGAAREEVDAEIDAMIERGELGPRANGKGVAIENDAFAEQVKAVAHNDTFWYLYALACIAGRPTWDELRRLAGDGIGIETARIMISSLCERGLVVNLPETALSSKYETAKREFPRRLGLTGSGMFVLELAASVRLVHLPWPESGAVPRKQERPSTARGAKPSDRAGRTLHHHRGGTLMRGINQCNFLGSLGRDAEIKMTNGGNRVANFSLACGYSVKKGDGSFEDKTEWVRFVCWSPSDWLVGQLKKGRPIAVNGARVQTRKWQDQSGSDRYATEFVAGAGQIIPCNPIRADQQDNRSAQRQAPPADQYPGAAMQGSDEADEIPF